MKYYIYQTASEVAAINQVICAGEGIGDQTGDVTNSYAPCLHVVNLTFAIIQDEITEKYITDRQAVTLTDTDFITIKN